MRDPNRINEYLKIVEKIWKSYPDFRFSQLLLNTGDMNYYEEDDLFFAKLYVTYIYHFTEEECKYYDEFFKNKGINIKQEIDEI